ncbi:hypothetical protein ACVIGB_000471 [Bradyrhizobium sp. USDA 4341]
MMNWAVIVGILSALASVGCFDLRRRLGGVNGVDVTVGTRT